MEAGFELKEHTADIAMHVVAPDLPQLAQTAVAGLYAVIGELVPVETREAPQTARLEFHDEDPGLLLRDFLAELLRLFEVHEQMAAKLHVETFEPPHLRISVALAAVDWERSHPEREAKAVTYHDLYARPLSGGGWEAYFIVDI